MARMVGRKHKRMSQTRFQATIKRSMMLGDNEGYAAEVANQHFSPEPSLIAAIQSTGWYEEGEMFPWEYLGVKTRGRHLLPKMLTPSVIRWIEAQSKKKPLSHALYNSGRQSGLLAEHVLRVMLGIGWTRGVQDRWFRYRHWRVVHEHERLKLLASTGVVPMDQYVDSLLEEFESYDHTYRTDRGPGEEGV